MVYLFIHGACHTAGCWQEMLRLLTARGEQAYALDLPGHGSLAFQRKDVTFTDYVQAVVDTVVQKGWQEVVLIGHSMAGAVIQKAAVSLAPVLSQLVFLAGYTVADQQSLWDVSLPLHRKIFKESAARSADNAFSFSWPLYRKYFAHTLPKETAAQYYKQLVPSPLAPWYEPLDLKDFYQLSLPLHYVSLTADKLFPAKGWHPGMSQRLERAQVHELAADHEVMLSAPEACVQLLLQLTGRL